MTWPWTFDVPPNETFVAQTVLKAGSPEIGAKLLPLVRDWWATRASALERAMNTDFRDTVEDAAGKSGLELLEVVCSSSSVLILRYLYDGTPFLLTKHEVFGAMAKALVERRAHLAHSVVVDAATGMVPQSKQMYQLTQRQSDCFWGLNFDQLDMVNADPVVPSTGGFLAIKYLETGATYKHVEPSLHYTSEPCLLGAREWFDGCLLGGGYSSTPSSGYTWFDAVDKQLVLIRFTQGLPASERASWLAWANTNFMEHALRRAASYARSILRSSEPGSEEFGAFLPPGAEFFSNIDRKLSDAEPIAVVRRSFPSLFSAEPTSFVGPSAADGGGADGGDKSSTRGGGKNKQGNKQGRLACMLKTGRLFLANYSYDVEGADRLSVCTDKGHHGGLKADVHKTPANFNRTALAKKHSRPATDAEREERVCRPTRR